MDEARFAALIRRHLPFYRALAEGARAPTTPAQRRFVAVARGAAEPETEHERAFLRWREAVARADRALAEEGHARFSPDHRAATEARLRLGRKRPQQPAGEPLRGVAVVVRRGCPGRGGGDAGR